MCIFETNVSCKSIMHFVQKWSNGGYFLQKYRNKRSFNVGSFCIPQVKCKLGKKIYIKITSLDNAFAYPHTDIVSDISLFYETGFIRVRGSRLLGKMYFDTLRISYAIEINYKVYIEKN